MIIFITIIMIFSSLGRLTHMSSDSIDWGETAEEGGEVIVIITAINIFILIVIIFVIIYHYNDQSILVIIVITFQNLSDCSLLHCVTPAPIEFGDDEPLEESKSVT